MRRFFFLLVSSSLPAGEEAGPCLLALKIHGTVLNGRRVRPRDSNRELVHSRQIASPCRTLRQRKPNHVFRLFLNLRRRNLNQYLLPSNNFLPHYLPHRRGVLRSQRSQLACRVHGTAEIGPPSATRAVLNIARASSFPNVPRRRHPLRRPPVHARSCNAAIKTY